MGETRKGVTAALAAIGLTQHDLNDNATLAAASKRAAQEAAVTDLTSRMASMEVKVCMHAC